LTLHVITDKRGASTYSQYLQSYTVTVRPLDPAL
jgi:hypothetical protein